MSDRPQILIADEGGRRDRPSGLVPPSGVRDLAPVLLVGGLVLSLAGWVDVLLFYWPPRFGEIEWEFGVISQTIDALPLPTLGLVLLVLALRTMPERRILARLGAITCALIALIMLALLVIFALNVPVAFGALARATQQAAAQGAQANPLMGAGLKRVVAKALLLGAGYTAAYIMLGVGLWRGTRHDRAT